MCMMRTRFQGTVARVEVILSAGSSTTEVVTVGGASFVFTPMFRNTGIGCIAGGVLMTASYLCKQQSNPF